MNKILFLLVFLLIAKSLYSQNDDIKSLSLENNSIAKDSIILKVRPIRKHDIRIGLGLLPFEGINEHLSFSNEDLFFYYPSFGDEYEKHATRTKRNKGLSVNLIYTRSEERSVGNEC